MQLVWIIIDIAVIGGLCYFLFIVSGGRILSLFRETKPSPRRIEMTCPYCGGNANKVYDPSDPNFSSMMFTCGDCYKSFGEREQLTVSEMHTIEAQQEACAKAEQIPEIDDIIRVVCEMAGKTSSFVSIHEGKVFTTKYGQGNSYLFGYDSTLGKVGDQHIAFLCMQRIKHQFGHLGIKVWLMEHGVAWEWPKV